MQNSDDMSPSAAASDREQHAAQRDYEEASSIEGDWSIPDETFEGTFTEFTDEDPLLAQEETPLGPCDGGEETVDDEPEGTPSEDAWSTEDEAEDAEPTAEQVDFAQSLQAFGRSSEFTVAKRTAWETLTSRPSKHMYGLLVATKSVADFISEHTTVLVLLFYVVHFIAYHLEKEEDEEGSEHDCSTWPSFEELEELWNARGQRFSNWCAAKIEGLNWNEAREAVIPSVLETRQHYRDASAALDIFKDRLDNSSVDLITVETTARRISDLLGQTHSAVDLIYNTMRDPAIANWKFMSLHRIGKARKLLLRIDQQLRAFVLYLCFLYHVATGMGHLNNEEYVDFVRELDSSLPRQTSRWTDRHYASEYVEATKRELCMLFGEMNQIMKLLGLQTLPAEVEA